MRKNIIMIFTDQMHKYAMGFLREHILTPNLDKLSNEGITFTNAYSNNPVCGPFRGNVFTGLYTSQNGVKNNGDPLPEIECLADTFNNNGYETSFVGKWHLGATGNQPIPSSLRGGFKHFIGYQCYNGFFQNVCFYDENDIEYRYDKHRTDVTTDLGIERLEMLAQKNNPFLHVIFYQAPHYPEQPSGEFYELYKDSEMPYPVNYQKVDPYTPTYSPLSPRPIENCPDFKAYGNNIQEYLKRYNAMVTQIDFGIGRILKKAEELGLSDETLILFSSDHGDMQGSHGLKNKCLPYEESCGIPLIIKAPDCQNGLKINTPVSCIDFYPTCVDYAGAVTDRKLAGNSLLPFLYKEKNESALLSKSVFAENDLPKQPWIMIRESKFKLSIHKDGNQPYLLFDMENDPFEMTNLVNDESYQQTLKVLHKKICDFIEYCKA